VEQVLPRVGDRVTEIMYTHVNKYKSDKINKNINHKHIYISEDISVLWNVDVHATSHV
jgi:hypothetical protein